MCDVLIYYNGTSTSIIDADSVKDGLRKFLSVKGYEAVDTIERVYSYDRGKPDDRVPVLDWRDMIGED